MKVLQVHNFYQQPGGEDVVFDREAALLSEHGHEVVRYTRHNDAIAELSGPGVALRTVWNDRTRRELGRVIRDERPDVAHFHNTFPLISPSAYHAVRQSGVPVVQTLHNYRLVCPVATLRRDGVVCEDCVGRSVPWPGVVHACYRDSHGASAAVAAMLATHRALGTWSRAVDAYVALTDFARRKFVEGGLPAGRIVVKPNFVHPDPGPGSGAGDFALFVGRLSPEKGVGTLLEAWRRLDPPLPLKIVGEGPLAERVAEAEDAIPALEWLGRRPPDEVFALMADARFVVFPSEWYEGFSLVLVEAFAHGTPVVASRLGPMPDIVREGELGALFRPGDPADLAATVSGLAGRPDDLLRMREAAREEFVRHYSAGRNHELLMDVYARARSAAGRA